MQTSFDFTGLTEQLGADGVRRLSEQWMELQSMLAARGRAIPKCGKLLTAMSATFGEPLLRTIVKNVKAPTWRQAQAMMMAWEFFGEQDLSDDEAAVLDAICYANMRRDFRMFAFRKVKEGMSAQEIMDLVDSIGPGPSPTPPGPQVTEDDIKRQYARLLAERGYDVHTEQPTRDGGRVDIVATLGDETIIAECKVQLDRETITYAIGQLEVYSHTYGGAALHVAYLSGQMDPQAEKVARVCADKITTKHVIIQATEPQS
jgi:hypothetical protein